MAKIVRTQIAVTEIELEESVDGEASAEVLLGTALADTENWTTRTAHVVYEVHADTEDGCVVKQFTRRQ
jgi:hypothetical protein